jgi:hypothetical protein
MFGFGANHDPATMHAIADSFVRPGPGGDPGCVRALRRRAPLHRRAGSAPWHHVPTPRCADPGGQVRSLRQQRRRPRSRRRPGELYSNERRGFMVLVYVPSVDAKSTPRAKHTASRTKLA